MKIEKRALRFVALFAFKSKITCNCVRHQKSLYVFCESDCSTHVPRQLAVGCGENLCVWEPATGDLLYKFTQPMYVLFPGDYLSVISCYYQVLVEEPPTSAVCLDQPHMRII